jgi:hypothetical protein
MSTSASTQTILTIVKDEFAEVLTEGSLFPATKPAEWKVIITEKALLEAARMPSPSPEEIRHGLATCYEQLLLFFFSSLTCGCLMFFILLIFTRVYLQENTSCQTHVLLVFASW